MPTPDDAREIAADAVLEVIGRLQDRDVDPDDCPRLLGAVECGVVQLVAAIETGREDVGDYRRYLDDVYRALQADPVDDEVLVEPPRRTLAVRW